MPSFLYEGRVWHSRRHPAYRLELRVFYLELALDELDAVARELRILGHNSLNLLGLYDGDYEVLEDRRWRSEAASQGAERVSLLTMPRMLGYVFNPVSFLLFRDAADRIISVAAEVHNTWGERHVYPLPPASLDGPYRSEVVKAFYVSPFLEPEGDYCFEVGENESGSLRILIRESQAGQGECFAAGLDLQRRPLTRQRLVGVLLRYPFLNLRVIGAIHWHALRLWLRGATFHPHPGKSAGARALPRRPPAA